MWPNPQVTGYLVTFTEEILNGKPHFLHKKKKYLILPHFSIKVIEET